MKWIRDLSIGYKVLIPPLIMLMALGGILFLLIRGFDRQEEVIGNVHDIALERTGLLNQFMLVSERVQSDLFLVAVLRFMKVPEEEVEKVFNHLDQGLQRIEILYGRISRKWPLEEEERALLKEMKIPLDAFVKEAGQAVDAVSQNPSFGVLLVRSAAAPFDRFRKALARFLTFQERKIARARIDSRQTVRALKTATLTIAGLAAVSAILVSVFIGGWFISRPVRAMTGIMEQLAKGNLSPGADFRGRGDEIGDMAAAVEVFRKNALEKQVAREALRISEANYRTIFDSANDAIFIQDTTTGRILDVSRKTCDMFGYTPEETRRMGSEGLSEGVAPYSRKEAMEYLEKAASGTPQIFEWKARRKDGKLFWVEVNLKRITLQNEARVLAIARDITDRKQAYEKLEEKVEERTAELRHANMQLRENIEALKRSEEALGASEEKFRTFFENSMDALLITSPERGLLAANAAAGELFGYARGELSGEVRNALAASWDPGLKQAVMEWKQSGRFRGELVLKGRDGTDFPAEITSVIFKDREGRDLAGMIIRDISERKRAEHEKEELLRSLFQSQKMDALGKLVAGVAHEINNPINQVLLNIPLFQKCWVDMAPVLKARAEKEPDREYGGLTYDFLKENMPQLLDYTQLAANRVAGIVKDLKDFSRQSVVADTEEVQVDTAVQNALRLTASTLRKSRVQTVLQLTDRLPPIVANLRNLEQILVNLILNGVQAIDHGHGEIHISSGLRKDEKQIWFSVSDNGRGVAPAIQGSLFDPFVSGRQAEGGTGLGLSVTYSLVKAHGGEIHFHSEKGTRFEVAFPLERG